MRRIDALFTARPFYGARRIARTLSEEGFPIDRKRVRRLMRRMGIEALGPKPRTSAIGLQELVANNRKRRWLKARVVSVTEKASE